ncbi:hypothetical protein P4S68_00015 [Pseudoalteromonas sp. Hal099]
MPRQLMAWVWDMAALCSYRHMGEFVLNTLPLAATNLQALPLRQ